MAYTSLIHLKTLLMVLTAAGGTVTGGVLANSYVNSANRDPGSFLITLNPSTMWTVQGASSTSTITITSINSFSGTVTLSLYFPGTTFTASISPTSKRPQQQHSRINTIRHSSQRARKLHRCDNRGL